jgi:hypothetical protein
MPLNDDVGYDIDAFLDQMFDDAEALEASIQAQQAEVEAGTKIAPTTQQLRLLQRQVRRLARIVKHLKRAIDGDAISDDLGS